MRVRAREGGIGTDWEAPPPWSCWPDGAQRELLRACLLPPGEALAAYGRWLARVDIQRLDHGSNRLLGLLFRNLSRAGDDFPHAALLKGNWRYHWVQNQLRMQGLAGPLRELAGAGVPVMLLKGAALLAGYYEDHGSRPMADADLLVPEARAREALEIFRALGYLPLHTSAPAIERSLGRNHALHLKKEGALDIDLHWYALHDCMYPGADDALWERSLPARIGDCACRVPGATDQFIHVCSHGMRYCEISPLRWLADAWIIMTRNPGGWDLELLCREADRRCLVLPVRKTVRYLMHHLGGENVRQGWWKVVRLRAGRLEWMEYPGRVWSPELLPQYVTVWQQYLREVRAKRTDKGFLGYYARVRQMSRGQALVRLIEKTVAHLHRWVTGRLRPALG